MQAFGIKLMKFGAALLSLLISIPLALFFFTIAWALIKSLGA